MPQRQEEPGHHQRGRQHAKESPRPGEHAAADHALAALPREPAPRLPAGTGPIGSLRQPGHATVQGRLHAAETRSGKAAGNTVLACEVGDSTGQLTAFFYGRTQITGVEPGIRIRLHGTVGIGADGHPAMINPAYELLA